MNAQDKQARELASQVVNYCRSKALSLGGLVERIKAAGYVTRETADAVIVYCEEHSLMLGGLVSTLASFSNEVADVAQVEPKAKATVRIVSLKPSTYTNNPVVMSWAEYETYAKATPGEGDSWKATLI